jgi:hypothetical protein
MHARLWISGQCFDCQVERLEPAPEGGGWVVRTGDRRHFRLDDASARLLRGLMARDCLDPDAAADSTAVRFLRGRLLPIGLYRPAGKRAPIAAAGGGPLRWQRPLLPARVVAPLAAMLARAASAWVLVPLLLASVVVQVAWIARTAGGLGYAQVVRLAPADVLALAAFSLARGLLHEFGHAAACWRFARGVGAIGVGVFVVTPVLFCDVSDIHLLRRRHKVLVGLGGTAMDVLALGTLVAFGGAAPVVAKLYWFSLSAVLLNLLPFYRNDGYWVLNDLVGGRDLLRDALHACRAGTARVRDRALLGFTGLCGTGLLALAAVFAFGAGPAQLAAAARPGAGADGMLLALVTLAQYAAVAFGATALAGIARRAWRRSQERPPKRDMSGAQR